MHSHFLVLLKIFQLNETIKKTCNHPVTELLNLQNQVQLCLNGQNALLKFVTPYRRSFTTFTPPIAQLKYNAQFVSDELG